MNIVKMRKLLNKYWFFIGVTILLSGVVGAVASGIVTEITSTNVVSISWNNLNESNTFIIFCWFAFISILLGLLCELILFLTKWKRNMLEQLEEVVKKEIKKDVVELQKKQSELETSLSQIQFTVTDILETQKITITLNSKKEKLQEYEGIINSISDILAEMNRNINLGNVERGREHEFSQFVQENMLSVNDFIEKYSLITNKISNSYNRLYRELGEGGVASQACIEEIRVLFGEINILADDIDDCEKFIYNKLLIS
ncbi:hypothetical protein [Bacillus cereus]|uniref:hypothetical protein n=1 Tax=Bacillus cereus TaxID=1396 RepID=UPI000BFE150D|nr:hypothetical protein [Bacillus cereus]PGT15163.1 hypothetical protein COC96_19910 [Bacillus cereus]